MKLPSRYKHKRELQADNDDSITNFLALEGYAYRTKLTPKFVNRHIYEPENLNIIRSKIPGVIKKIAVSVGNEVKRGTVLCIVDAMKMHNEICAFQDGIITDVYVKPGQTITKETVLFNIIAVNDEQNISSDNNQASVDI